MCVRARGTTTACRVSSSGWASASACSTGSGVSCAGASGEAAARSATSATGAPVVAALASLPLVSPQLTASTPAVSVLTPPARRSHSTCSSRSAGMSRRRPAAYLRATAPMLARHGRIPLEPRRRSTVLGRWFDDAGGACATGASSAVGAARRRRERRLRATRRSASGRRQPASRTTGVSAIGAIVDRRLVICGRLGVGARRRRARSTTAHRRRSARARRPAPGRRPATSRRSARDRPPADVSTIGVSTRRTGVGLRDRRLVNHRPRLDDRRVIGHRRRLDDRRLVDHRPALGDRRLVSTGQVSTIGAWSASPATSRRSAHGRPTGHVSTTVGRSVDQRPRLGDRRLFDGAACARLAARRSTSASAATTACSTTGVAATARPFADRLLSCATGASSIAASGTGAAAAASTASSENTASRPVPRRSLDVFRHLIVRSRQQRRWRELEPGLGDGRVDAVTATASRPRVVQDNRSLFLVPRAHAARSRSAVVAALVAEA